MKQHITVEQLNELSEKGKEKLLNWLYEHGYSWKGEKAVVVNTKTKEKHKVNLTNFRPLLSIGQMIEFVDEKYLIMRLDRGIMLAWRTKEGFSGDFGKRWEFSHEKPLKYSAPKKELCDALWEAVKEVLNGLD